jgi:hypothetical protein
LRSTRSNAQLAGAEIARELALLDKRPTNRAQTRAGDPHPADEVHRCGALRLDGVDAFRDIVPELPPLLRARQGYPRRLRPASDSRFIDQLAATQRIVTSGGQNDAGLFSTNIDENLRQERYLPFEGAGASSSWHLEMPRANNEIEIDTVTDVVLHVRYAALHDDDLAHAVRAA